MWNAILFNLVWADLAQSDEVDEPGSMEYCRVYAEWISSGSPGGVSLFIREHVKPPQTDLPPIPVGGLR